MRRSFGPIAKIRVKRILEALLFFAVEDSKGELHSYCDSELLVKLAPQKNQLVIKATIRQIADLVNQYEKSVKKDFRDQVSSWHVADAFEHFQKTLEIFEDLRTRKQGAEVWTFRLTLWHPISYKKKNLDEIDLRFCKTGSEGLDHETSEKTSRNRVPKRWWERELKPLNFIPFLKEKRQHFTGREWIFDEIEVRCTFGQEKALIITGDPGSGKSAFISEFINRNPQRVLAYHFCFADIEQTISAGSFVRSIAGMIAQRLNTYAELLSEQSFNDGLSEKACQTDPIGAFEFKILNPLHSLVKVPSEVQFILIDGLDAVISSEEYITGQSIVHLLSGRLQRLPDWLRIVCTSRKETQTLLRLSRQGVLNIKPEDMRNKVDISRYLDYRFENPRLTGLLQLSARSRIDIKVCLSEAGDGNFLYVQQALEGIENNTYSFSELDRLPPGLSSLYLNFLEQSFFTPISYEQAKILLQVIAVSREILSAAQLATVTGMDLDSELYPLLIKLNTYLSHERGSEGFEGYKLYHKSLIDWLTGDDARQTPYYISSEKGHKLLSKTCEHLLTESPYVWRKYLERYTSHHFIESGCTEKLIPLLISFPKLIRYTVDTIVNEILKEGAGIVCKSRAFLKSLVNSDQYIAFIIYIEIISRLVEFGKNDSVNQSMSLADSSHPYHQQTALILKLQKAPPEAAPEDWVRNICRALKEDGVPSVLKGILQYYLSEYLILVGKHKLAHRASERAIVNLDPTISFNYWMKSQFVISRLEIKLKRPHDAWARLSVLQKVAEASDNKNYLERIYDLYKQIY